MGKVARGGGSGQGRSPALAGGGKGKGKDRVDQVVKVLSGKTVDDKQATYRGMPLFNNHLQVGGLKLSSRQHHVPDHSS